MRTLTVSSRVFVGVVLAIALLAAAAAGVATTVVLREQAAACERGNVSRQVNRDQNAILRRLVRVVLAQPTLSPPLRPEFEAAMTELTAADIAQADRRC